jgi:O-antigen ligase
VSKLQQSLGQNAASIIIFSVLFLVLPLVYWPEIYEAASLPRYFLISIITSITLVIWAISNWRNQKEIVWHSGFFLIICFFGWATLSTAWSPDSGTSLIDITQLLSMVVLAFLAMQMSSTPAFLTYLIPAILTGAALTAMIGIGQFLGFNPLELRTNANSVPATFINPNHAAVFFDFIPWLAFAAILFYQRGSLRWLAAVSLGLCVAYISVNTSRGSLFAFFVSGLLLTLLVLFKQQVRMWLKSRILQRYKEITLAILIPVIFFLLPIFLPSAEDSVEQWNTTLLEGKMDLSSQYRLAMYLNSLPAILDHPLQGLGYGGMRVGFQPYTSRVLPTGFRTEDTVLRELHSDPLQYVVELGLPGGLLAITIFYVLIRVGFKMITSLARDDKKLLILGFWLGLITCGTHTLIDFPLRLPASAAMFWLSAGILLGLGQSHLISLPETSNRPLRIVLASTGIIGLLFYLPFYHSYLSANHDLYTAIVNLKKNNCAAAARASENGLETFASDFMLQTVHAQIYTFCNFPPQQKLAAMNRVIALDPSNMRARLTRAILYNDAGRPELAIPEFELVTEVLPHRPYAYAGLGDAARLQKADSLEAHHYYLAALKRKPDYKYAKQQLMMLEPTLEE